MRRGNWRWIWQSCLLSACALGSVFLIETQKGSAEEPDPFDLEIKVPPVDIMIQVEAIELDHRDVTRLLLAREMHGDGTALREEVQQLIDAGKAEIVETGLVVTKNGCRVSTQGIAEFMQDTEQDVGSGGGQRFPSTSPNPENLTPEQAKKQAAARERFAREQRELVARLHAWRERAAKIHFDWANSGQPWPPAFFPTPPSYETRNLGLTFEVDLITGRDPEYVELTLGFSLVAKRPADDIQRSIATPEGELATHKRARFLVNQIQTALTIKSGAYGFAGISSAFDAETGVRLPDRKLIFFARACILE